MCRTYVRLTHIHVLTSPPITHDSHQISSNQERDGLKENVNMRALVEYRAKEQEHKVRTCVCMLVGGSVGGRVSGCMM